MGMKGEWFKLTIDVQWWMK